MHISFKSKLFITFVVYGLVLLVITQIAVFNKNKENIRLSSLEQASEKFLERDQYFQTYIQNVKIKLLTIQNSDIFTKYIDNKTIHPLLNTLFLDIASSSNNIMQLRFIDTNGMEKIRVDRKEFASKPYHVDKNKLQNKDSRYYFQKISNLHQGEYWYSNLDLNVEHGEIQKPLQPVLRIGMPLYNKGKKIGILLINIFMKEFLDKFTKTQLFDIFLIDKDGYLIAEPSHKYCWSKYLHNDEKIYKYFKIDALNITSNDEFYGYDFYSNKLSLHNNEDIRMVLKIKQDRFQEDIKESYYNLLYIIIGVVLLSFPISYFLSIIPSRLKEKVDSMVTIKTKELKEINENLEERILKRTQEQTILLSLFDLSDAVLFKWNNDENWSVESVSKSVEKLLSYAPEEFQSNKVSYSNCIHHDDLKKVMDEVTNAIDSHQYFFTHDPYRVVTKDGSIKWILDNTVVVRNNKDEIINFVGYLTDITELKENELKLKNLSITDQLTKISNRMHIDEMLQNQYYRFCRSQEKTSIILLDIDFFKSVNDEFGHLVGDVVLVEFASLLQSSIRTGDTVGRWGGEEFLIILPHTNLDQALKLAEKLRVTIENHIFSTIKHKTASFGVATFSSGMNIETLLDTADTGLYKSKNGGRNMVTSIQEVPSD